MKMRHGVAACFVAALLFGASAPLSKALLKEIGPLTLAGLLYLGAAIAVAPFSVRGGSAELRRRPAERLRLVGAVVAGGMLGPVFLLIGLRAAPASSVSLWLNAEVVATLGIAWAFFHDELGRRGLVAAAIVLLSGVLLAVPEGAAGLRAGGFVLLACVFWGIDNNLTAGIGGFTPAQVTLAKGVVAGVVNFTLGMLLERGTPSAPAIAGALALGSVAYGLSILAYITGAQQLGAARSQLVFAAGPFLGVALSWLLLGERIEPAQLVAMPLMASGIALLFSARHEHAHEHAEISHTHRHSHDDGHHDHEHDGPVAGWHTHAHDHAAIAHAHSHVSDLHHRHGHAG